MSGLFRVADKGWRLSTYMIDTIKNAVQNRKNTPH